MVRRWEARQQQTGMTCKVGEVPTGASGSVAALLPQAAGWVWSGIEDKLLRCRMRGPAARSTALQLSSTVGSLAQAAATATSCLPVLLAAIRQLHEVPATATVATQRATRPGNRWPR